jgi:hypothetical protein
VGCSTPERPTKAWIEGHADGYKEAADAAPLKPVGTGGGACGSDYACGGRLDRGQCLLPSGSRASASANASAAGSVGKQCACGAGWVGPWCRASAGEDPIDWEALREEHLPLATPWLPAPLAAAAAVLAAALLAATVYHVEKVRPSRTLFSLS